MLEDVLEHASRYNDVSAVIDGKSFKRIETVSYPGASLREGIMNAFAHADYFIRSNIKIEFYENQVKITNPGGIYKATLNDIMSGVQTYRNPGLVRILDKLGYIENFGTGIPRIMNAYSESEKKPIFQPTDQFFSLYLPNMNDLVSDPVTDSVSDPVNRQISASLSDFDLLLMKTINDYPGLRVPGIMKVMTAERKDITENMIKNSLKRGLKNYVKFIGAAKNGGYYLKKETR